MAKKTVVQLIDDLDKSEVADGGQTIRFALQKEHYEIDLSGRNVQKLQDALAPFIAAGRRVDGRFGGEVGLNGTDPRQTQAIRQWAREHGMAVRERGRVSKQIQEAYRNAN